VISFFEVDILNNCELVLQNKVKRSVLTDSESDDDKSEDDVPSPTADGAIDSMEIPVSNSPGELASSSELRNHFFTECWGGVLSP